MSACSCLLCWFCVLLCMSRACVLRSCCVSPRRFLRETDSDEHVYYLFKLAEARGQLPEEYVEAATAAAEAEARTWGRRGLGGGALCAYFPVPARKRQKATITEGACLGASMC